MTPLAPFAAALLDADAPLPPGLRTWNGSDPARRLAVYRNNVVVSLVEALAATFPVVHQAVGDDCFRALARTHLQQHPPTSPIVTQYGTAFPAWLATFEPLAALPWLPDLARLELARVQACHAADAAPLPAETLLAALQAPDHLAAARPVLHPACRLVDSRFSVVSFWAAHQQADVAGALAAVQLDRPECALVLRDPDDAVCVVPLDGAAHHFCAALQQGTTLGQACADAQAASPDFDLTTLLALLLHHGALVGWQPGDTP